jgi:hypothetical protein
MSKTFLFSFTLVLLLFLSGCTSKTLTQKFQAAAQEHQLDYKTLMAICKKESSLKPYVVNVNESIFDIQRGPHYFDGTFTANLYMDFILDPLLLNYDVGMCQINKIHLDRFDIDNEDLLDEETNIDISAKIYKWNLKACRGNVMCALSMYNTGTGHSPKGKLYAQKVLHIRREMFGN